jgi:hypothetical protein
VDRYRHRRRNQEVEVHDQRDAIGDIAAEARRQAEDAEDGDRGAERQHDGRQRRCGQADGAGGAAPPHHERKQHRDQCDAGRERRQRAQRAVFPGHDRLLQRAGGDKRQRECKGPPGGKGHGVSCGFDCSIGR